MKKPWQENKESGEAEDGSNDAGTRSGGQDNLKNTNLPETATATTPPESTATNDIEATQSPLEEEISSTRNSVSEAEDNEVDSVEAPEHPAEHSSSEDPMYDPEDKDVDDAEASNYLEEKTGLSEIPGLELEGNEIDDIGAPRKVRETNEDDQSSPTILGELGRKQSALSNNKVKNPMLGQKETEDHFRFNPYVPVICL